MAWRAGRVEGGLQGDGDGEDDERIERHGKKMDMVALCLT
jgi:hypothetical protein